MPRLTPVPFEDIEMKALWIYAEMGSAVPTPTLDANPAMTAARDRAIAKLYAASSGIPVAMTDTTQTRVVYPIAFGAGRALLAGLQGLGVLLTRLAHRPRRLRPAASH